MIPKSLLGALCGNTPLLTNQRKCRFLFCILTIMLSLAQKKSILIGSPFINVLLIFCLRIEILT